jgi:hypothetical protein
MRCACHAARFAVALQVTGALHSRITTLALSTGGHLATTHGQDFKALVGHVRTSYAGYRDKVEGRASDSLWLTEVRGPNHRHAIARAAGDGTHRALQRQRLTDCRRGRWGAPRSATACPGRVVLDSPWISSTNRIKEDRIGLAETGRGESAHRPSDRTTADGDDPAIPVAGPLSAYYQPGRRGLRRRAPLGRGGTARRAGGP